MPVFSLIVPVYNVEQYLAECLDSCVNQTFKDIEIICINDCSPDNSKIILEKYAAIDSRIRIINHDKNKGLGGARNTGIDSATGKYIWFIDSDDYILLNACDLLYDIIKKYTVDIIYFRHIDYSYDESKNIKDIFLKLYDYKIETNRLYSKEDYAKIDIKGITAWTYIGSRELLRNLRFRESVIHEDIDFTIILFSKAKNIFSFNCPLYCYRHRAESITEGGINGLSERGIIDVFKAIGVLYDYTKESNLPKNHFCYRRLARLCSWLKRECKKGSDIQTTVECDKLLKKIEKHITVVGNNKIYNDIITNYGNTKILEFILKIYRAAIKRLLKLSIFLKRDR